MCFSSQVTISDPSTWCTHRCGTPPLSIPSLSVDRRHLCTSSKDRTCLLWDLELGIPVVRWSGHTDAVGAIAASCKPGPWMTSGSSSGCAFVVSGAADRTLQRWDVPGTAVLELEKGARASRRTAEVEAAGFEVDGGDGDGAGKGKQRSSWTPPSPLVETAKQSVRAHEKDINCIAVSPNDAIVASASQDRTVRLWSSSKLEPLGVLKGHKRGVWKVCRDALPLREGWPSVSW